MSMDAISRRLLFRIGSVGFSLGLDELIEIREQVSEVVDTRQVDLQLFVAGALPFRRTMIPVVDLATRLDLEPCEPDTALVLSSAEGNWALMVDKGGRVFSGGRVCRSPSSKAVAGRGMAVF